MVLSRSRAQEILARIPALRIAVVGDFFLDKYMVTDPALAEVSIETGLEARQVVEIRCSPGAAGTVTNNLSALGVGTLDAVGVIGHDGQGFELRRELEETGVRTHGLLSAPWRFTPTYTKPMVREAHGERELERLDIKNRTGPDPASDEWVCASVQHRMESIDGPPHAIIVADQVQERNCGVVTDRVRALMADLASAHPGTVVFADSRVRIGEFRGVIVKPNRHEAAAALGLDWAKGAPLDEAERIGRTLAERNGKPVFVTLGDEGMLACDAGQAIHVPAVRVEGPIDIVGAGDSATAGIVCALCAGADLSEAAMFGNLCASVTIRKLGTTGTASPDEVLAVLDRAS